VPRILLLSLVHSLKWFGKIVTHHYRILAGIGMDDQFVFGLVLVGLGKSEDGNHAQ
jgi:hypothetical protein